MNTPIHGDSNGRPGQLLAMPHKEQRKLPWRPVVGGVGLAVLQILIFATVLRGSHEELKQAPASEQVCSAELSCTLTGALRRSKQADHHRATAMESQLSVTTSRRRTQTPQEPKAAEKERLPIPSTSEQKEALKMIKSILKVDYAKRSVGDIRILARTLLEKGRETADDANAHFVLLTESRDMAARVGDVETAVAAVDELADHFTIDSVTMKMKTLAEVARSVRDPKLKVILGHSYCDVTAEAIDAGELDAATTSSKKASAIARATKDSILIARAKELQNEVGVHKSESRKIKNHLGKTGERDKLAVGSFLCFVRGDWGKGLPLLAEASSPPIRTAARMDLTNPTETGDYVTVGDAWWDISQKERNAWKKDRILERAGHWYELAVSGLRGLDKSKIEIRLRETRTIVRRHGNTPTESNTIGGTGGTAFTDQPEKSSILIGFKVVIMETKAYVKALKPIYLEGGSTVEGGLYGDQEQNPIQEVLAKKGYAVGAVTAKGSDRVNQLKITFMRMAGAGLDLKDTYETEWIGGPGGTKEVRFAGNGSFVVGIHGKAAKDLDCFGLIYLK